MQKPWVAPENRPSVISATFVPSPCVLDRVLVYAHARQNTDANNRHARERAWCLHLRFILWVHALELTNAHAVCVCMHACVCRCTYSAHNGTRGCEHFRHTRSCALDVSRDSARIHGENRTHRSTICICSILIK